MYLAIFLMLILQQNGEWTWQNICRKLMFKMVILPKMIKVVLVNTNNWESLAFSTNHASEHTLSMIKKMEWAQLKSPKSTKDAKRNSIVRYFKSCGTQQCKSVSFKNVLKGVVLCYTKDSTLTKRLFRFHLMLWRRMN